ncbi:MAG: hypothetical protein Mars2KO_24220 [Maribacter sp.]
MTVITSYSEFEETLIDDEPNVKWPEALKAMWYDANGNWAASHDIAQEMHTRLGSWIHAYLHRKEGDEWNAGYWYRQANQPFPKMTLAQEHREITDFILNQ